MTDIFISDLHLCDDRPALYGAFCRFLVGLDSSVEQLYILGDLFDAYVGEDPHNGLATQLKGQLKLLAERKIRVFLQPGNRDFLLDRKRAQAYGMTLLDDFHLYEHAGNRALLMHGDLLCTDDVGYQRYRQIIQSPLMKGFAHALPLPVRRRIARNLRNRSKQKYLSSGSQMVEVSERAVRSVMERFNVEQLIHGHTHQPGHHRLGVSGRQQRYVLGDWSEDRIWWIEANRGGFSLKSAAPGT